MKLSNVLVGSSWGDIEPSILQKGVGGREGALLNLSREWAKQGHDVTNFVSVSKSKRFYEGKHYHEYVNYGMSTDIFSNFPYDVVVAWECPSVFNKPAVQENIKLKLNHLQCCNYPSEDEQELAGELCDFTIALSEWHKGYLIYDGLKMNPDNIIVLPNGINLKNFPRNKDKVLKKPWRFVYSSSPDRGLWHLLKLWPHIRKLDSEAELCVTYGVKQWCEFLKWSHNRQGEMAVEIQRLMRQDGIADFGKIGQDKLAKLLSSATAWVYPLDPAAPTETSCITILENFAAGNPCIVSDADLMEDEYGDYALVVPLPFVEENFMSALEYLLGDETAYNDYKERGYDFVLDRDWSTVSKRWITFMQENLN